MVGDYTVYIRDRNRRHIANLDIISSLEMIARYNDVGNWSLEMPRIINVDGTSKIASTLFEEKGGISVFRNGEFFFGGPYSSVQEEFEGTNGKLVVSGHDDNVWLARRILYPAPLAGWGSHANAASHDVRSGPAEAVIRGYVWDNTGGDPSLYYRLPDGFTCATGGTLGANIVGRARFQNMLEFIQGLARVGGVGFKVVYNPGTFAIDFNVFVSTDRSSDVKFSREIGNLAGYKYSRQAPRVNFAQVAGDGELTARSFRVWYDNTSIFDEWGLFEEFVDARGTNDFSELDQKGQEAIIEGEEVTTLSLSPLDTESIKFGRDYFLGDKVSVIVEGNVLADIVREVHIKINEDGEQISPMVGTQTGRDALKFVREISHLHHRNRNLERR